MYRNQIIVTPFKKLQESCQFIMDGFAELGYDEEACLKLTFKEIEKKVIEGTSSFYDLKSALHMCGLACPYEWRGVFAKARYTIRQECEITQVENDYYILDESGAQIKALDVILSKFRQGEIEDLEELDFLLWSIGYVISDETTYLESLEEQRSHLLVETDYLTCC